MISHANDTITAIVKGIHNMLYIKDEPKLPFIISSVARPIPQPGQGMPVANLNKQTVVCL